MREQPGVNASPPYRKLDEPLLFATAFALATLLPVAAHQLGLIEHLPDPPGDLFASDRITGSAMAHPFGVPDSLPGIASYSATLCLILLSRSRPHARRLLALKLLADSTIAGINVIRQVAVFRKICSWCTGTAVCTAAMFLCGRDLIHNELSQITQHGLSAEGFDPRR